MCCHQSIQGDVTEGGHTSKGIWAPDTAHMRSCMFHECLLRQEESEKTFPTFGQKQMCSRGSVKTAEDFPKPWCSTQNEAVGHVHSVVEKGEG